MLEQMVALNALDRCDRCMAQAYCQAEKDGFTSLLFCGHHIRQFGDALMDNGWTLRADEAYEELTANRVNA